MVSTTLTTIAAGQQTSSSSNYHHHHQSTNATGIASSTANSNNLNYQKAQHQQQLQHHSSSSTTTATATSATTPTSTLSSSSALVTTTTPTANIRNSYHRYNNNNNSNNNYSSAYAHKFYEEAHETANQIGTTTTALDTNNSIIGSETTSTTCTNESNRKSTHQYHQQRLSSALYSDEHHQRVIGGSDGGVCGNQPNTRPEEPTTTAYSNTATSYTTAAGESVKFEEHQTTKTAHNEIVNLSQAILSTSSKPLNDQISLLFPKCRPKHATSNGNGNSNINGNTKTNSNIDENITTTTTATIATPTSSSTIKTTENLKSNFVEPDLLSNTNVSINGVNSIGGSGVSGVGVSGNISPTSSQQCKRFYTAGENFCSPPTRSAINDNIKNSSSNSNNFIGGSSVSRNYYRSVNIITQSPPPASTSSVSSESLSSVTPRISTNPFLCSVDYTNGIEGDGVGVGIVDNDIDEQTQTKLHEDNENSYKEELPVPTYRTFYYHTSSTSTKTNNSEHQQQKTRNHVDDDYYVKSNDEMPRKRNNYSGGGNNSDIHAIRAAAAQTHQFKLQATPTTSSLSPLNANDNQQPQQLQDQQLQQPHHHQQFRQIHMPFNYGNESTNQANQQQQQQNQHQNPFIREGYWDAANNALQRQNLTAASSTTLKSPDTELPTSIYGATSSTSSSSSSRRAFHQQAYGSSASYNETGINKRLAQQQPHQQQQEQQQQLTIRLARSPNNLNKTLPATFAESSKSNNDHFVEDQTTLKNSCAGGLTPMAGRHYSYGGRRTGVGVSGGGGMERLREQDVRDKRDVGQFQQPSQTPQTHQLQQQLHRQQQQQQNQQPLQQQQQHSNNTTRNMTADGRLSMISNGEVVVFDDITESWQNLKVTTDTNAPRLSPKTTTTSNIAAIATTTTMSSKNLQQQQQQSTLTVIDINDELNERRHHNNNNSNKNKNDEPTISLREHKKFVEKTQGGSILNSPLKARHGIIEYEGSPRRIGYGGNNTPDDGERLPASIAGGSQNQNVRATNSGYNNATNSSLNSNSPQQYPARPGFPQRIMSPPRETTPTMMIPNKPQQQQPPLPTQPQQQQSLTDNNAEDTSNDVSEIGTISDLTTPEAISAAAALIAVNNSDSFIPATTTATLTTPIALTTTPTAAATTQNTSVISALTIPTKSSTFDYLYEFSETRKVLEEFFKCPSNDEKVIEDSSDIDSIDIQYEFHSNLERDDEEIADVDAEEVGNDDDDGGEDVDDDDQLEIDNDVDDDDNDNDDDDEDLQLQNSSQQKNYFYYQQDHHQQQQHQKQLQTKVQQSTASASKTRYQYTQQQQQQDSNHHKNLNQNYANQQHQQQRRRFTASPLMRDFDFFLDSASRSSGEQLDQQDGINQNAQQLQDARNNYRYSPETTDYDSNCGDVDSLSGEVNGGATTSNCSNYAKFYASSMPVLEDGLSSGHTSDNENNNHNNFNNNLEQQQKQQQQQQHQSAIIHHAPIGGGISVLMDMKRVSTNNSLNNMHNITSTANDGIGGGIVGMGVGVGVGGVGEKINSLSPNILHDACEMTQIRKLESPINNIGLVGGGIGGVGVGGIHDDSIRDSGRMLINRENHLRDSHERALLGQSPTNTSNSNKVFKNIDPDLDALYSINVFHRSDLVQMTPPPPAPAPHRKPNLLNEQQDLQQQQKQNVTYTELHSGTTTTTSPTPATSIASAISSTLNRNRNCLLTQQQNQLQQPSSNRSYQQQQQQQQQPQPPPPPIPEQNLQHSPSPTLNSPVWLPRHLDNSINKNLLENSSSGNHSKNQSADEEDIDTDLETDRLLGHQRLDDQGYYEENKSWERNNKTRSLLSKFSPKQQLPSTKTRNGYNALLSSTPENPPPPIPPKNTTNKLLDISGSMSSSEHSDKSPLKSQMDMGQDCVVGMNSPEGSNNSLCPKKDLENGGGDSVVGISNANGGVGGGGGLAVGTNALNSGGITLLQQQQQQNSTGNGGSNGSGTTSGNESGSNIGSNHTSGEKKVKKSKNKEGGAVLIEGVLFRAKYLGSTQLVCEGQPTKSTRMMQAEEAVSRIKAPDSDVQPSTEVDLFISTEKIMVLNTDLKEIMMDHALRTISYIADIGDLVVLMARRRFVPQDIDDAPKPNRTPKMICHVFESDEAQFIAQSIGQAFQVAYMEFLKANGIEDHSFVKEMDYQEVLNSQEIFGDELEIFAKKELQKEVVVPKAKGEILGVVIVESGWGSMLPTVVIANLMSSGAAARCGQLNIGDQLIAINGLSLVGLPLSTCQNYIKNTKNQTVVKFTVVPCPPVVEVKIKRPNTKYQLGFSVQNGVICSLLRGGIAERGGVRVGHRIIEINNQSVVAVPHEKIVNLLATSVGEILMKTMPTSMFRLLTGQENPIYI